MIDSWPQSVQIADACGTFPLHYACKGKSPSLKIIQSLVEAWPGAVRKQENNGRLPLHCACENGCSDEIIQFLVAS